MAAPVPPPPPSGPSLRRPGLQAARPRVYDERLVSSATLRAWAARRRVSVRDFADALKVSERVARQKLSGEIPFGMDELQTLPIRDALEILDDMRSTLLLRRAG